MRVTFYVDRPDVERLRTLEPDRDWREFQQGDEAWIVQTYLRLASAGAPVELSAEPAGARWICFHAKQKRAISRHLGRLRDAVLVAVRGDLQGTLALADFEIVQNRSAADGRRRHFLPHWPQPGLLARDPARGDRCERLAYKGFLGNLAPSFLDPSWERWLAEQGVGWLVDAVAFEATGTARTATTWPDFRDVDAVLAVRPPGAKTRTKPATKLYNAWLAGTPTLLGPEPAYRELRTSELDYLEVDSSAAARAAVTRLLREPGLFRAMVENGARRAVEFAPARTVEQWRALLGDILPVIARAERGDRFERMPPRRRLERWYARIRSGGSRAG